MDVAPQGVEFKETMLGRAALPIGIAVHPDGSRAFYNDTETLRVDVFDWATAINHRRNKDAWNLWFTGQGSGPSVGPFSALKDVVSPQNNQFVADPALDKLFAELVSGATFEARKASFGKFQDRVYEQVLFLKFGDLVRKQAALSNVKGFVPYRIPRLWNVWLED